jgi:hypothetical protein
MLPQTAAQPITLDAALATHIGEFGWGQVRFGGASRSIESRAFWAGEVRDAASRCLINLLTHSLDIHIK